MQSSLKVMEEPGNNNQLAVDVPVEAANDFDDGSQGSYNSDGESSAIGSGRPMMGMLSQKLKKYVTEKSFQKTLSDKLGKLKSEIMEASD